MKRIKFNPFTVILCSILAIYVLITLWMLVLSFLTTFKDFYEYMDYPLDFPKKFSLDNYMYVWDKLYHIDPLTREKLYIEDMLWNSLFYAIGCATVQLIVCSVTAYATSMFDFKFSGVIYMTVIFCMAFPVVGSLPSEMKIVHALNLTNSIPAMFVLKANFLGIYYMIFYSMFRSVPKSCAEAAKIDGASNLTVMLKIYYPLCVNTLLTVWLLYFIAYWNDYQTLMLYSPRTPTISLGLWLFKGRQENSIPQRITAAVFVFIPILIVFILSRKKLMGNLSMDAAVKG